MLFVSRMKCYFRPSAAFLAVLVFASGWLPAGAQILGTGDKVPGMIQNDAMITFEAKERPLRDVLDHIRDVVGVNILLRPGIEDTVNLKLNMVPWRDALDIVAEATGCIVIEKSSKIFEVEKPPRVTFSFIDEDIKLVINAIAQSAGADVIIAPEVEGKVNMNVDDIPWMDALDNVVKTLGYYLVREDRGVLRVVTADSLTEQLESRIFELKYIRPKNVYVPKINSEYLEGENKAAEHDARADFPILQALESMLSSSGKLDYFQMENVIFAKDIKPNLDKIAEMIERLDQEPLQVEIKVQFLSVEKRESFDASFGFAGNEGNGLNAAWSGASKSIPFPFNLGAGGFNDTVLPGPKPRLDIDDWQMVPDVINGTLDFSLIRFLVELIQVSSHTRISQVPRIVTIDHHQATINVGESVRWAQMEAESSQWGGLKFTIKEADSSPVHLGFQLFVTPHIIPGTNKIVMCVIPEADSLSGKSTDAGMEGFDKFAIGEGGIYELFLPRVRSQTMITNLLIESGQTGVIGGLVSERQTEIVTKIPGLAEIPILGYLFKSKSELSIHEELLVLITPNIIEGTAKEIDKFDKSMIEHRNQGDDEFAEIAGQMKD